MRSLWRILYKLEVPEQEACMLDHKHIALIRLSSVGDVLHCTPVARAIKKAAPASHLLWIVGAVSADILSGNPYIDEVYVWSREHWEKLLRQYRFREAYQYWEQLRKDLYARHIDIALDVHGIFISGLVALATGAPQKIGLSGTRELNSWFMTETAPRLPEEKHVIQRYLSILRPLGIQPDGWDMTLKLTAEAADFADSFLARHDYDASRPLIAINPKTTWPAKNWPPAYFAAAAAELYQDGQILLCGGPGDRDVADSIIRQAGVPVINAIGETSLSQLAALVAQSQVLLTGDTGPLHMAVALRTPTVSIFGPTDPAVFGPLSAQHIVLRSSLECTPCHKQKCRQQTLKCLYDVLPQTAVAAVRRQLTNKKNR
jgi:3-deoxy-D-manno-octulosonic-acid transferase